MNFIHLIKILSNNLNQDPNFWKSSKNIFLFFPWFDLENFIQKIIHSLYSIAIECPNNDYIQVNRENNFLH